LARTLAVAVGLGAMAFGAIALSARGTGPAPREIRLVVRDMNFYVEGQADPNPTIRVRTGETIRLVLRNEDDGMRHDFAVPGWHAATARIESGQETAVTFQAPGHAGSERYTCRPHDAIMRGTILVE
jgi:plastocyanin